MQPLASSSFAPGGVDAAADHGHAAVLNSDVGPELRDTGAVHHRAATDYQIKFRHFPTSKNPIPLRRSVVPVSRSCQKPGATNLERSRPPVSNPPLPCPRLISPGRDLLPDITPNTPKCSRRTDTSGPHPNLPPCAGEGISGCWALGTANQPRSKPCPAIGLR